MKNTVGIASAAVLIAVILLIVVSLVTGLLSPVVVVPAGSVGVHDLFGNVDANELYAGFHFKNPFADVKIMSIKTQAYTMSILEEEGTKTRSDTVNTLTKEGLSVDLDLTVLYRLDPEKADQVYKSVGTDYADVIVRPQIRSVIREVIARYEAKDIYSAERNRISGEIYDELNMKLNARGIIVEQVLLRNVKLPPSVQNSIEAKITAEQNVGRMSFVLQAEELEAKRKVVEAQGIADSNTIIRDSIDEKYLYWYWINSLNNKSVIYVPTGSNGMPMFKEFT
ncbi:prohibitin family protein [Methanooceanicella nereidis]|uniref:prohibitin family protein n=1 Tax=Methanooceanicella nereidis TaxID=2052831 RepID=UPI001E4484BB|nr:prohibitin family protein [Methanocella sp. CWC-04]